MLYKDVQTNKKNYEVQNILAPSEKVQEKTKNV